MFFLISKNKSDIITTFDFHTCDNPIWPGGDVNLTPLCFFVITQKAF